MLNYSKNRTLFPMTRSLISFLASQPTFKIIRGLMSSSKPRHLRELASQYDLSPAGVSDIIRRLQAAGVLSEERKGNRRYLTLQMSAKEQNCFNELFSIYELDLVRERAPKFGKGAAAKLEGMDEGYLFYKNAKRR